jgi:hypothetical protein
MPDPETAELRLDQLRRERAERERAQETDDDLETAEHERRADRAAYLKAKLNERAEAEDRAEREDR